MIMHGISKPNPKNNRHKPPKPPMPEYKRKALNKFRRRRKGRLDL
jgi:hypothetical protein